MLRSRGRRTRFTTIVAAASAALLTSVLVAPTGATAEDGETSLRGASVSAASTRQVPATDKIASELTSLFKDSPTQDFWVKLGARADNTAARVMSDWNARGTSVAANLRAVADESQAPIRELLADRGVAYESFWISNAVKVTGGTEDLALELAGMAAVEQVFPPVKYVQDEPIPGVDEPKVDAVEWGVADINADDVWDQFGVTGEGITIANIDTGVDYTHPALVEKYRGNLGNGEFDNNYNWYDAAGIGSDAPTDYDIHGTHTMGTMVGDDGGANQVGVAPGAKWIATNGCCTSDASALDSMQWILEPTDLEGENPDASKRPNIVSNSWGVAEVPTDPFGDDIQQAWIDSGIFASWSNRNLGPACDTTGSPGGRAVSYSSGAYDINHAIAYFSSRGPGQDGMIKPNLSGPGVNVRSSVPGGGYSSLSGTSMSTPHTAATVALLWSAAPTLIGDIEGTRAILDASAIDVDATECGGTPEDNNVFGEGRLDALAAVESAPIGDTGTVAGTVTDGETGEPLAGATVEFSGPADRDTTTDEDGTYEILLSTGTYDVTVSAFGYVEYETTVDVEKDTTTTLDIELEPAESYSLFGRVRDRATGEKLPGVTVEIEGTPLVTVTNEKGGYHFYDVPAGTYDVTATGGSCYVPRTKEVVIDGIWPDGNLAFKGDERKRFRLGTKTDEAGYACHTEAPDYTEGEDAVDLSGDEEMQSVDIPFDFPYYGETYDAVELSTNGHLRFEPDESSAFSNIVMPDPTPPNAIVAPFWDDMLLDDESSVWTLSAGDAFVVEYRDLTTYDGEGERIDFTVTFYDSGEILFTYRGIDPDSDREMGSSATVGIENADGTVGLMYGINETMLDDATAIRFTPGP